MKKGIQSIAVVTALLLGFYLATALLANIVSLTAAADRFQPGAGGFVFWGLFSVLAILAVAPFALFFRLPKALIPPETAEGPVYEAFRRDFIGRLKHNALLAGETIESEEDVARACA